MCSFGSYVSVAAAYALVCALGANQVLWNVACRWPLSQSVHRELWLERHRLDHCLDVFMVSCGFRCSELLMLFFTVMLGALNGASEEALAPMSGADPPAAVAAGCIHFALFV